MNRTAAALGSAAWLLAAPGVVCGLVPWLITRWDRAADTWPALDLVGGVLIVGGTVVLLHAFVAFAWHGLGTPAPAAPTERLVVRGFYRYVRNPMYVAVDAVVLGQVLLFRSWPLLAYLVLVAITTNLFVRVYEEPTLRETYGGEYDDYLAAVPRWIPRLPARSARG